jgi:polysaccharide transporter, PST family
MIARREFANAGVLMTANLLSMALPLIVLPVLAQRLGLHAFGLMALAQSVGFIAVLLVDAGFNTESMRTAGATGEAKPLQPLLDNLIARARLALPAAAIALACGSMIPGLPWTYLLVSLLQLLGTLLFAQWWLIAAGATGTLLALQLAGRIAAVGGILLWVHDPGDGLLATALQCGATAVSGLLFIAAILLPRWREFAALDRHGHRALRLRATRAVGAGFLASLSSYAPQLLLGAFSGAQQVGLYAAAEKLVRAVAFAVSAVDQSFVAPIARRHSVDRDAAGRASSRVVFAVFVATATMGLALAFSAPWLVRLLFGADFAASAAVLFVLCAWLPSYASRRAFLNLKFAAQARIADVARSQYAEAVAVTALVAVGAWYGAALGAAIGLLAAEVVAWMMLGLIGHRSDRARRGAHGQQERHTPLPCDSTTDNTISTAAGTRSPSP